MSDCPSYTTDVLDGDVLQLTVPEQSLADRGHVFEHVVQGRLKASALELELYATRRDRRVLGQGCKRLVSVGVWSCGGYVHWRNERLLDFVVLDTVDLCLRDLLPPGGGVVTFKRANFLTSGDGVKWGNFKS
jgi:hypothetical protein